MVRKILQIGDPILEKQSKEIEKSHFGSKDLDALIKDLIDTAKSEGERSAGLSAPQIGENLRVYVARRFDLEGDEPSISKATWDIIINPKISAKSDDKTTYWEGCLSIGTGKGQLYGPVARARKVELEYFDREGEKRKSEFVEFMSHVMQHEIDHLNGILFLSHVKNPENIWTSKALDDYMNRFGEYPAVSL